MGVNLTYQWQKDETDITGANSDTYMIAAVVENDEGMYRCVVSNTATSESVTSDAVSLTVGKCVGA